MTRSRRLRVILYTLLSAHGLQGGPGGGCSASFLLRPSPRPALTPPTKASITKTRPWSGRYSSTAVR
jgi:hypothetical protein